MIKNFHKIQRQIAVASALACVGLTVFWSIGASINLDSYSVCSAGHFNYSKPPEVIADTIEATGQEATVEFWLNDLPNNDMESLSDSQIDSLNKCIRQQPGHRMYNLEELPRNVDAQQVKSYIEEAAEGFNRENVPDGYVYMGRPLTQESWNKLFDKIDYSNIQAQQPVEYAVVVRKTNLRLLPSSMPLYYDESEYATHFDQLQGTAIDPDEAVAVLAHSTDQRFAFVLSRTYSGWIDASTIATANDRQDWLGYVNPQIYGIVLANRAGIEDPDGNGLEFQMGARIPLKVTDNAVSYILPIMKNGKLKTYNTGFNTNNEVITASPLLMNRYNLVKQAFAFQGKPYDWGGKEGNVDCSALVQDVYRTIGVELPRNANDIIAVMPNKVSFEGMDAQQRIEQIKALPIGSILYNGSHVLLYIGMNKENKPMVIHSTTGYYKDGEHKRLMKVTVTGLDYVLNENGDTALDCLTEAGYVFTGQALRGPDSGIGFNPFAAG